MNIERKIERSIHKTPVIDKNEFPPLTEQESFLLNRESLLMDLSYRSLCFPFLKTCESHEWYIDIYYIYEKNKEILTSRFIIAPGYQMSECDEDEFGRMLKDKCILFHENTCKCLFEKLSALAPELHLEPYGQIGKILFHAYWGSFRSGIREKMLKAGLINIAVKMDSIIEWNMTAQNVEAALKVPLKLLRKLNTSDEYIDKFLLTASQRELIATAYKHNSQLINGMQTINEYQVRYLNDCINERMSVDRKTLHELKDLQSGWDNELELDVDGDAIYSYLRDYQAICREVSVDSLKFVFPLYPSLELSDIGRFLEAYALIRMCLEHSEEMEKKMLELESRYENYHFQDEKFVIVMPYTIGDIIEESEHQHNCLYQYVSEILEGKMMVLFMRTRKDNKKSLVTIEVNEKDRRIEQARGRYNRDLSEEENEFIGKFAIAKKLRWVS